MCLLLTLDALVVMRQKIRSKFPVVVLFSFVYFVKTGLAFRCETWDPETPAAKAYLAKVASSKCELGLNCCDVGKYSDPYIGTLEQGPHTPWCHQGAIPGSPSENRPEFYINSPGHTQQYISYDALDDTVNELVIDASRELWILIHGFGCEWPKPWMPATSDALVAKGHNVMLVRWSGDGKKGGSCAPDYYQATANSRTMGAVVARLAKTMMATKPMPKLDLNRTTILGFSLGAHVAGFAGARLPGLHKIIGVDPAGPLYSHCGIETRLNHTDANFVQVFHCNGEVPCCGSMESMGHVDFFANGGLYQPGCPQILSPRTGNTKDIHFDFSCSHLRCPLLFLTSILTSNQGNMDTTQGCEYKAYPCASTKDWNTGLCLTCHSGLGCAVPGYETGNESPFRGTHYFGTLATNKTSFGFCGMTYKLILTAGSKCGEHDGGCKLTAQLGGPAYESFDETLSADSLTVGQTVSRVIMVPWPTKDGKIVEPDRVRISFKPPWYSIYEKFSVHSVQAVRDDGLLFETAGPAKVDKGKTVTMKLVNTGRHVPL